jgi:hypothetical protein
MFWKILQWVQFLISLIREAEDKLGAGRGPDKKALVLAGATRELDAIATAAQIPGCAVEVLAGHVGNLIDAVVGLFNCFGVFAVEYETLLEPAPAPATEEAPKTRSRRS